MRKRRKTVDIRNTAHVYAIDGGQYLDLVYGISIEINATFSQGPLYHCNQDTIERKPFLWRLEHTENQLKIAFLYVNGIRGPRGAPTKGL